MKKAIFLFLLIFALYWQSFAAMTFTANSSNRVVVASPSTNYFAATSSACALVYPAALDAGYESILDQSDASFTHYAGFYLGDASAGDFGFFLKRATTDISAVSVGSVVTTNTWQWLCVTVNTATNAKLYRGVLGSPLAEVSYASQTLGAGAATSGSAFDLYIGNNNGVADGFPGTIAVAFTVASELSVDQLNAAIRKPPNGKFFSGYWYLGITGTTSVDYSGNVKNGTVTGATAATVRAPLGGLFSF